jgi:hypothetical protein
MKKGIHNKVKKYPKKCKITKYKKRVKEKERRIIVKINSNKNKFMINKMTTNDRKSLK